MSYLYNLEIKPLSVMLFANTFSHSVGYFFISFVVSFAVQKIVTLSPICLFLFLFLLPWETDLRKHCYDLCQRMFCPYGVMFYKNIILLEGNVGLDIK